MQYFVRITKSLRDKFSKVNQKVAEDRVVQLKVAAQALAVSATVLVLPRNDAALSCSGHVSKHIAVGSTCLG